MFRVGCTVHFNNSNSNNNKINNNNNNEDIDLQNIKSTKNGEEKLLN